jgi:hypothetical protein
MMSASAAEAGEHSPLRCDEMMSASAAEAGVDELACGAM